MTSQAETIAIMLGGARRSGRGWIARCPAHDDHRPSLSLADGENGRLLVKCFAGCDPRAILSILPRRDMADFTQSLNASVSTSPSLPGWSQKADAIFKAGNHIRGTLAEVYLLRRGCALPETDEVRFLPSRSPNRYPAMLSRITDAATGKPISLHFTLLTHDGSGKAPIEQPKILLSGHQKKNGVIRLINDEDITSSLGIAEGIETVLSVVRSGWRPVWAVVDAGNMATFPVLDGIEALTIFADNDRAGLNAVDSCASRWIAAGRSVRIVPPNGKGTDWNG